ncbi:hypothetical protein SUGI_0625370 [Cryptomeria japonica]|nr:hypothetical protein SUGI_0625370 [Cryptomeria japonica]
MSGGGRQGLYPLWKYVDRVPGPKGSGGTATIKCKLCNLGWKGTYTRVKAHFLHLPCNGVEGCPNECERYDVVREQERADGKVVMRSSHVSTTGAATTTYSHDIESEVDVTSRDPGYNEGPSAKWDQISPDRDVAAIVDEVVEADGLADLPPVILPSEEPEFESDDYLESLIADDLDMDDHGEEE